MKRPILLAALLAASSAMVPAASAEETHTGQMLRMFDISTPSAGVVNFRGTGTANFNQSIGTNNNFNVGSSTNLGVNASASSTEDYTATGDAFLSLAGTSRLQQTIGTATSAFNVATANESSSTAAHTSAFEVANSSSYGSAFTSDYANSLKSEGGWEYRAEDVDNNIDGGWYSDTETAAGRTGFVAAAADDQNTVWDGYAEESWNAGWKETYDEQYKTSYQSAVTASSSQAVNTDQSGIISGVFSTVDYGASTSEVTSAQTEDMSEDANTAAANHITKTGDDVNGYTYAIVDGGNYDGQSLTQSEMESAYDKEYTKSFNTAFSAAAGLMRSSDSTVTVTGIGVIADVNASDQSVFKASSTLLEGAVRDGNGNGQASSGANLATSSYANQSNSSTASAFMQAFSGGLPDQTGATTIQKVNPVYEDNDPTKSITGYMIETSVVQAPAVTEQQYDIETDANGNAIGDGSVSTGG